MFRSVVVGVAISLMLSSSIALSSDLLTPIGRKKSDDNFGTSYQTDYSDRKLEAGVDGGYTMIFGATTQAFDPSWSVSPYLDVSFGDGNSIVFAVPMGFHSLNPENAGYYFFRTPIIEGTTAQGQLQYFNPNLAFRYESDLSPNLSRRGRAFLWTGLGIGAGVVASEASLTGAGSTPEPPETSYDETRETFLTIAPAVGMKFRVTEYLFVNATVRYTFFMEFGYPEVAVEGDIGGMQLFESSLGISYEFGG